MAESTNRLGRQSAIVLREIRRALDRYRERSAVVRWGFVALWCGMIFYASSVPTTNSGPPLSMQIIHNAAHVIVFGALAGLVYLALSARPSGADVGSAVDVRLMWALAVGFAGLYGVTDELHQLAVPGRKASWWDGVSDVVGAVFGATLLVWLVHGPRRWIGVTIAITVPLAIGSVVMASR